MLCVNRPVAVNFKPIYLFAWCINLRPLTWQLLERRMQLSVCCSLGINLLLPVEWNLERCLWSLATWNGKRRSHRNLNDSNSLLLMSPMRLFVSNCTAAAYNDVIHQQITRPVMRSLTRVVELFDLSGDDGVNFLRLAAVSNPTQNTE